jgi:hypothetical protein
MAGSVTQLHAPRAATRLGPKEARILAQRARAAGHAPGAARALLMHLLRVCDPRQGFSRALPHHSPPDQDKVTGLTEELGVSERTLIRAIQALERAQLLTVARGSGRTWSRYTLDARRVVDLLGELPGSPWATEAFTRGQSEGLEGGQIVTPEVSKRHPRGDKTAPPYVRARESDRSKTNSPLPPGGDPADPWPEVSPPTSGRGPLSICDEHHQLNCRACGLDRGSRRALEQAAARARADEARRAEQRRHREEAAAARARAKRPDPASIKSARAVIRTSRHPDREEPSDGDSDL